MNLPKLGDAYLTVILIFTVIWVVYFIVFGIYKWDFLKFKEHFGDFGKLPKCHVMHTGMVNSTYIMLPMVLIPGGVVLFQGISKDNFRLEFFIVIILMLILEFIFSFIVLNIIKPYSLSMEIFVVNLLELLSQAMTIYAIVSVFLNKISENVGQYVLVATLYVAGIVSYKFALKTYIDIRDKK